MIPRRSFLCWSAGALTAGVLAPLATGCGGVPVLTRGVRGGRFTVALEEFRAAASEGDAIAVDVGDGWPVLLMRGDDDRFFAVSSRCTHQSCRVRPAAGGLVCPCHGSAFDREGRVVRGPAQRPLPAYRVTVAGPDLHVEMTS
jgi:Rieske Fe-S protein